MRRAPLLAAAALAAAGLTAAVHSSAGNAPAGPAAGPTNPSAANVGGASADPSVQLPLVTPFQAARTERMLRQRVACRGCHVIHGEGGRIGPTLEGLAARATPEYVLEVIRDPARVLAGTIMPRQPMPRRESERLAAYLLTPASPAGTGAGPGSPAPDVAPRAPTPIPEGRENEGAALYARHCAACHGPEGQGDGWNAPALPVPPTPHADSALMSARPDDTLYDAIAGGAWVLDGSPMMPPFGEMLTPLQIRALVEHIRALCGCEGPAWSTDGRAR